MTKTFKCLARESKKNFTGLAEFIRQVPRYIVQAVVLFLPLWILCAHLILFRPAYIPTDFTVLFFGDVLLSLVWLCLIGIPIDACYITPDGEVKGLIARIKENLIGSIHCIVLLIKFIPCVGIIIVTVFLPVIIGGYLLFSNATPELIYTPINGILIIGLCIITVPWCALIGMPLIDCYFVPLFGKWYNPLDIETAEETMVKI